MNLSDEGQPASATDHHAAATAAALGSFTRLLARARSEYIEMPGLRLTARQAARLWALDRDVSLRILRQVTDSGFLWQTADGAFLLRTSR